jgi:hypothetical protein
MRLAALAVVWLGVLGCGLAAGRSTLHGGGAPDPLRLDHGIPGGVRDAPAGALAAADNYVATGVTASLDPNQLRQFANSVVDPAARGQFIASTRASAEGGGPPPGARVIASVVAHRLNRFDGRTAAATEWALGSYWDGGVEPTQYSALVELSLRWSGSQWQIESVRESLPGPVPAVVADRGAARTSGVWDEALSGMSSPFYGDS